MANKIQLLPDHVANQIAAGEVIQRPASVVKELLENAIDAQATHIQLHIKEAGKTLIQVIDNGTGMLTTDLRLAFERHATSKIRKAEDLFQLSSKGFRGEALASIAAITHVDAISRTAEDELASQLIIEGSKVMRQDVVTAPVGTTFTIKNLFFNIPARRNFLKSNTVELRHIFDEFHRVALAHPEVEFKMTHNGAEVFHLPKGPLQKRIVGILGAKAAEKLVPINEETSIVKVGGFIIKPAFAKKTRGQQYFFVNNRFVKSPYLHHALLGAFEGLLQADYHPGYFIYLEVDPQAIDINIHPTKTEVKFEDEQSIYAVVKSTVKHALGMFQIAPVLDFDRDTSLDVSYDKHKQPAKIPSIEVDASFNPFREGKKTTAAPQWESLYSAVEATSLPDDAVQVPLNMPAQAAPKVFQLLQKFIVSSTRSALLIVHQQRAHQRVLYERFLECTATQQSSSQQLLFPLQMELTPEQKAVYDTYEPILKNMGFDLTFTDLAVEVKGIPVLCEQTEVGSIFEAIFELGAPEAEHASFSPSDRMAKTLARVSSIKSGTVLSIQEQQALVDDLFSCKESTLSPFNQQIFITLNQQELDLKFN